MNIYATIAIIALSANQLIANDANYQEIYDACLHTMAIRDGDMRKEGLKTIRQNHKISDNDFSLLLIRIAADLKTNDCSRIRGFAMNALLYFSTTNAMEYVRNEAVNGPEYTLGLDCYGLLTGFGDNYFELVENVMPDSSMGNARRRWHIYVLMEAILLSDSEYYGRHISLDTKLKFLEFLRRRIDTEPDSPISFDHLMQRVDPEYHKSSKRKINLERMATALPESSPMYGYFQAELAALTNSAQTVGAAVDGALVAGKDDEPDDAEKKNGRGWIAIAGGAVAVLVIAGLVVRGRRGEK